ncbi:hypothetical protein PR202_ga31183 [Eleusine coracana subsp. coracana]|uniref:Uncharacterized protein n=1 Tax=Eleusine coracana subsp. coracana TaxID=191504 RepID=A0AAV5DRI9_ELECO|nr:hypothetical protein PR202_ga31183 [Eleusine coracana subsp. coracana]
MVVILVTWLLWKHRNGCVLDETNPDMRTLLRFYDIERHLWCLAGANSMASLGQG